MCEPTTIAMLTIAAVGAVTSHQQAQRAADATADSIEQSMQLAADTAAVQQGQINQQAADEKAQRSVEALAERGRIRAILGESGLAGNNASRIEGESYFNQGTDMASIESNRQAAIKQSQLDAQAGQAQSRTQLNSLKRPSALGTGLQIAGAGLDAYSKSQSAKQKAKGTA